mgnify:CR=1 FL=1
MAIIYTYPTKTTLALADTVLISDSADSNKTKNATVTSIKDAIDVVDTLSSAFGTYITGTANTAAKGAVDIGTVDLSAVDGTAETTTRFLSKDNTWDLPLVYSGGANIGYVPTGGIAGRYLDGAGTWSTIDLTTDVNGILAVENGGTGGGVYTAGDLIYYAGPAFTRLATSGVTDGFVLTAASGVPTWALNPGGNGPGTGTQYTLPIWATTSTLGDSLITQNSTATSLTIGSSASGAESDIVSFSTVVGAGSTFSSKIQINGQSSNSLGGQLSLQSPNGGTRVTIEGPADGGTAYAIKMPDAVGTANQVLKLPSTIPGSGASQLVWGDAGSSGTLAVSGGGTGNTTIGQYSVFVGTSNTALERSSSATGAIQLPSGTTAQRPSSPVNGMIRYSTTNGTIEAYIGGSWVNLYTP